MEKQSEGVAVAGGGVASINDLRAIEGKNGNAEVADRENPAPCAEWRLGDDALAETASDARGSHFARLMFVWRTRDAMDQVPKIGDAMFADQRSTPGSQVAVRAAAECARCVVKVHF